MTKLDNKNSDKTEKLANAGKRTIAEKLAIAAKLREVQAKLAPIRAANRAKRAAEKIEIKIKTA